ncbi:hypothetical protein KUV22_14985 [Microbulbifer agarilyticus]|uniref:SPOR domain-containing protein n=1 Tax=Microbulbifer agarilyticus TaxID=260552 RepID=UPI001C97A862|nr:hypothetical protein [Microbulbifer agarilyticus]MBY6191737.1 hypothetical protein [Microbulbifer agarilyticus]
MRWIFFLLVVANLGLFGWFMTAERTPAKTVVVSQADRGADTISLVSELDPEDLAARAPAAAAQPPVPPVAEADTVADPLCTMVGPFDEAYQGEDVVRRLQALQVEADLRDIEMQGQMRYWVYLAPLNSSKDAFRKLRELQAAGVDSYVIPKGSLENGISFGIFSEIDRAQSLTEELRARGFDAEYREEPQTYLERWVVLSSASPAVDGGSPELVGEEFWQQLQLDYPDIGRRQNVCSEIREAGAEQ